MKPPHVALYKNDNCTRWWRVSRTLNALFLVLILFLHSILKFQHHHYSFYSIYIHKIPLSLFFHSISIAISQSYFFFQGHHQFYTIFIFWSKIRSTLNFNLFFLHAIWINFNLYWIGSDSVVTICNCWITRCLLFGLKDGRW